MKSGAETSQARTWNCTGRESGGSSANVQLCLWSSDAVQAPLSRVAGEAGLAVRQLLVVNECARQDCRAQGWASSWQREDACFESSRLQGSEQDNRLDEKCLAWCVRVWSGSRAEREASSRHSWGLGPGWKVGWDGWLEGGVLLLVLVQVSGGRGCVVVSVPVLVLVVFLSPLARVVSAGWERSCCVRV